MKTLLRTAFSFDCLGGLFHSMNPWVPDLVSTSPNRFYDKRHTGAHDCLWLCWISVWLAIGWAHHTPLGTGAGRNRQNTRKETACSFSISSLVFRAIFTFITFLPCHSAIMLAKGKAKTCCKMIPPLLWSIFYLPARFLIVSAKTSYRPRKYAVSMLASWILAIIPNYFPPLALSFLHSHPSLRLPDCLASACWSAKPTNKKTSLLDTILGLLLGKSNFMNIHSHVLLKRWSVRDEIQKGLQPFASWKKPIDCQSMKTVFHWCISCCYVDSDA